MTMPAGKWWIGDLCYVLHAEWDEYCDITIKETCLEGEFVLADGRRFATYSTAYGDGTYDGISVDSGTIGCILLSDIDLTNPENCITLGRVVEFNKPFTTSALGGAIRFGDVSIDTGSDSYYEDDEDDEY